MISDIQVNELPKLTTHEVDSVKFVSSTNFTQLNNISLSNKIKQSNNIQTHELHSTPIHTVSLGIWGCWERVSLRNMI